MLPRSSHWRRARVSSAAGLVLFVAGLGAASGPALSQGTTISGGAVLPVSADSQLGAPTAPLTFDDGTLQFLASFNLAPTRPITLGTGGGIIDTNGFNTTISQGITGVGLLIVQGGGTVTLSGANTHLGGTGVFGATIKAGAVNTFNPASVGAVVAGPGGTIDLDGFNQTVPLLFNQGTILTNGTGNTSLTVTGQYVGMGGTLGLNTVVAGDGSPSDRLVIGGTATGQTLIGINNIGGLGALTTGSGILVVDALPGANTDDAFRLAGPVIAGPYEYTLFKGDGNPEAWYLRSTLNCALPGAPSPPCPAPPPGPTPPAAPPAPPPPDGGPAPPQPAIPNFRQEVSLYTAVPALSLLYGRMLMDTLHERVGGDVNLRSGGDVVSTAFGLGAATAYGDGTGRAPGAAPAPYAEAVPLTYANGAWGRVIAQHGEQDGDRAGVLGSGPRYDYDFLAIQAGVDVLRWQSAGGTRTHAGIYGALGDVHGDVRHFDGRLAGRDSFTNYTVGGYWTWFGQPGWYLDGVVQGTWYDVKAQSTRMPALETDGWGLGTSLEAGYPFRLFGGWTVEPQAQLVYQTVELGSASDIAARVRFDDVDSLAGRLGVRLVTSWLAPAPVTAWVRPSIWQDVLGEPNTLFSSQTGFIPFRADLGETWVEINAGIAAQVGRNTALFASGSYEVGVDGRSDAWDGKLGLRVAW
jgi:outer membrane autotransporter protein